MQTVWHSTVCVQVLKPWWLHQITSLIYEVISSWVCCMDTNISCHPIIIITIIKFKFHHQLIPLVNVGAVCYMEGWYLVCVVGSVCEPIQTCCCNLSLMECKHPLVLMCDHHCVFYLGSDLHQPRPWILIVSFGVWKRGRVLWFVLGMCALCVGFGCSTSQQAAEVGGCTLQI